MRQMELKKQEAGSKDTISNVLQLSRARGEE